MKILFICESVTLAHLTRAFVLTEKLFNYYPGIKISVASSYNPKNLRESPFRTNPDIKLIRIDSISSKKFLNSLNTGLWPYNYKVLKNYHENDLKLIKREKPNLIIGDFRLSLETTCESLNLPFLGIINSYWKREVHKNFLPAPNYVMFKLFSKKFKQKVFSKTAPLALKLALNEINKLRKEINLKEFDSFEDYFCHNKKGIYPDSLETLEVNPNQFEGNFIGLNTWSANISFNEDYLSKKSKNIYLALGSSGNYKIVDYLIKSLNEFNIITSDPSDNIDIKKYKNVHKDKYLPGATVTEKVDLVITNGGSQATYEALKAGKPVLGIPSNLDQLLCMQALNHHRSVKTINTNEVRHYDIASCARKLLSKNSVEYANILASKINDNKNDNLKNIIDHYLTNDLSLAI